MLTAWTLGAASLRAQDPFGWLGPADFEGLRVAAIDVEPAGPAADTVRALLKLRVGEPLTRRVIDEDLAEIWTRLSLPGRVDFRKTDRGEAVVVYRIMETTVYARHEFKGLSHFTLSQVNTFLKLPGARQWTDWSAATQARLLQERYYEDGYLHARVEVRTDPLKRTVTFMVDEGPRVTVGNLHFRGNKSFAADGWFFHGDDLIDGAKLESTPSKWYSAQPYSQRKVEQDVERLRLFYHRKGYRDAQVELVGLTFDDSHTQVDITYLIEEGPRYKVASVDVEQKPAKGRSEPYYPVAELRELIKTKAGAFYDGDQVNLDKRALEKFYGKRGHPSRRRFGRSPGLDNMFDVEGPREVFDVDKHEVHLVYVVHEGSPKTVRDLVISGNVATKDAVIRRRVRQLPGQTLDMDRVERAQASLESTRFFETPNAPVGVEMLLDPTSPDTPDVVDLRVIVQEGNTGSFLWGVGLSSDLGVQGNLEFRKRNFDLFRLPSSADPITVFREVANNQAFHGAGQDLDLNFRPGTRRSDFQVTFFEPDLFGTHFETIGLRVRGNRTRTRLFRSFTANALSGSVGLERNLNEFLRVGVTGQHETMNVGDIDANAPTLVWEAEGQTELRSLGVDARYNDVDRLMRPTSGVDARVYYELFGSVLGGGADFFRAGVQVATYLPVWEDDRERRHVLYMRNAFEFGDAFGDSDSLFPTERFYMGGGVVGGAILRGFNRNGAGPSQFGQPAGGEARYLATLEYGFPIFSTRLTGQFFETEIIRGVLLTDFGLLGSSLTSSDFAQPRWAAGFGVRITIPGLNLPLAMDLAWPLLFEETDDRRVFYFTLSPR